MATAEEFREQSRVAELQPHHAKALLRNSRIALAYLVFPLLEGILKRACKNFVAFDGKVVSSFTIPTKQGTLRTYNDTGSWRDRQCSSLRDLLVLHHTRIAEPDLVVLLEKYRNHIAQISGVQDAYDVIYDWRNASLHGSTSIHTIGGTLLGLTLIITLFEIKSDFERRRVQALETAMWDMKTGHRTPQSFYPPF